MARVRLSVAQRREELLRAAIEQIEARGVAAVRIADVASALGVSNALVLYHFSTKEKLVAAAFTHAAEDDLAQLRKLLGRRTTALRRLRAAVRWYAPTGQAKGWRLWIEGWAAALREPALKDARPEQPYQFERLGYFALDSDSRPDKQVWNRTITLKDTWAKEAKKT